MNDLINKIKFSLVEFELTKLDTRWKTENFHLTQPGIPFARLYYPIEGDGYIMLNGETHILRPGEIYLIAPYAPVMVGCARRLVKYWGHFNAFILDSSLDIFTLAAPFIRVKDISPEFTTSLFNILSRTHARHHKASNDSLTEIEGRSALMLLLVPFLKTIQEKSLSGKGFTRFASLLAYIETHLPEGLTLQRLAEFTGLNATYLSNLFAEKMGIPLMKYCNQRSIQRAMDLMWSGKYSFSEAAYGAGAENVTAFSRLFKKHTGLSPRMMQKRINASGQVF
ncbi:MAG: hypothetical protein A2020_09935 [Lentisphaerae bacterium GWF2_45_14]|nr:MAG: hypothetical protein A2020_09935 [Lentisphaerae bacterium GWF2_45_14]